MKTLVEKIDEIIERLDVQDTEGHIWWNRFREMVITHESEKV